ncbi:class I SAM-dependent methyltransferase [Neptuniibacter sp.]|uniref:class I SAM-dependent methyltransferase n=1 Tax=Neptuniibacter sp. TaxID=1962643 RepID=UPI002612DC99|nr:class I SAM-dependent methyltransferase [Neptuniibacter sp.]MCP4597612.1 methyltransferase domain-containing protein [Neptuniibacter sp.]
MSSGNHYEQNLQADNIISRVQQAYPNGADQYQLAPIDQLHIGGIKASQKLLKHLTDGELVLEIGSGLGGLMRLAQQQNNLQIIGLDISHGLNKLNCVLAGLSITKAPTTVITGDAHLLPFSENCFDSIILQHSLLNMPNPTQVLNECLRVLQPKGKLILHEVLEGENVAEMKFPVPWAEKESGSHLMQETELKALIVDAGFELEGFSDWSTEALEWRKRQASKEQTVKNLSPVVSPAMVLGDQFSLMAGNLMRNLSGQSIRVVELVLKK